MPNTPVTLEVLHAGQQAIQRELTDFKTHVLALHIAANERMSLLDNIKNGAVSQFERRMNKQGSRIMFSMLTASVAIIVALVAALASRSCSLPAGANTQKPAQSSAAPEYRQERHEPVKTDIHLLQEHPKPPAQRID